MATTERDHDKPGGSSDTSDTPQNFDPRDTEHPTGTKQAAQNTANDPPA
jgi:hypothetical protein